MSLSTFARMVAGHSRRVVPTSIPKALFSSVNSKFNLPPIPADGIYRRPETLDLDKPLPENIDEYFLDDQAPERIFDANGDLLSPWDGLRYLTGWLFLLVGCGYVIPHALLGDENAPRPLAVGEFPEVHQTATIHNAPRKLYTSL